jgi:hypothetical protein
MQALLNIYQNFIDSPKKYKLLVKDTDVTEFYIPLCVILGGRDNLYDRNTEVFITTHNAVDIYVLESLKWH